MSDPQDMMVGQLALARGWLSLAHLLEGVRRMTAQGITLTRALRESGWVEEAQLEALWRDVTTLAPAELADELSYGHTIVTEHVHQTTPGYSPESGIMFPTLDGDSLLDVSDLVEIEWETPELAHARARYTLMRRIGRGGMGEVWLAEDNALHREIALKLITPERRQDAAVQRRLSLEAQVTGRLEHPSIIPIYDLGELSEEGPYYAMRVVRETSLSTILDRIRAGEDAGYSLAQLVGILRLVLLALQYAHDHGVIHRDLKPENLLVGAYGEVFIIDWGIAKIDPARFVGGDDLAALTTPKPGNLMGTPMYMAPEQALGENDRVDERTDVYAMGVILYEILTLEMMFDGDNILSILFQVAQQPPQPPSQRAPERHIPAALEEICMRAVAKAPEARYQSAQEMAHELELYLEGVKEKQRRQQMAEELLRAAEQTRAQYHESRMAYTRSISAHAELQARLPGWAPLEEKEAMWREEQRADALRLEMERAFGEAARAYGQALDHVPELPQARRALAELYWQRFLIAEAAGDEANALYFEGLVRRYNDGQYNTLLAGLATLSLRSQPPGCTISVYRFERELHRLQRKLVERVEAPVRNMRLPHGSYVVTFEHPGHMSVTLPLLLDRLDHVDRHILLPRTGELPEEMILIPGGEFLSGTIQALDRDRHRRIVETFAIQRAPVTCQQYVDFLNDVAARDPARAMGHAPRVSEQSEPYFEWRDGQFHIPVEDAEGDAWDPQWPICMVSYHDACAYAQWRADRELRPYRLPSALEWEKAARGVDGRLYPWGDDFDPSFCHMRESVRGRPMPKRVSTTPLDRSPYGVMDMAGNIIEWTSTPHPEAQGDEATMVLQGAAFNSIALLCRLDWSLNSPGSFRYSSYGFRLAMDLDD